MKSETSRSNTYRELGDYLQNTYTNADKLLTAAEELAHTGECDPDEIYSVARELEAHVASFAARVEQRRRRLDLAVLFYTREKELANWADELRQELQQEESAAEGLETVERSASNKVYVPLINLELLLQIAGANRSASGAEFGGVRLDNCPRRSSSAGAQVNIGRERII